MTNLEPPWGICGEVEYKYFNTSDPYTTAKCQLECETKNQLNKCHCKSGFMPGSTKICSLDSFISCVNVDSQENDTSCTCPNACEMFSYSTSLSFSQLSGSVTGGTQLDTEIIQKPYLSSLEIASRVQATAMIETVGSTKAVVSNQRQLQKLITERVLNPATSVSVLVLKELNIIISVIQNDFSSTKSYFAKIKSCYDLKVSHLIESLTGQLSSTNTELFKVQSMSQDSPATISYIGQIRTLVSSALQLLNSSAASLREASQEDYCPKSCLEQNCLVEYSFLSGATIQKLQELASLVNFYSSSSDGNSTNNSSDFASSTSRPEVTQTQRMLTQNDVNKAVNFTQIQFGIIQLTNCMTEYSDFLTTFQSFLSSTDFSLAAVDTSIVLNAANKVLQDSDELNGMLVGFADYNISKLQLSYNLLGGSNSKYALDAETAVNNFESSVLADLLSITGTVETRSNTFYSKLVFLLSKLETYMPIGNSSARNLTQAFQIWRNPVPMPLDRMLMGFKVDVDQVNKIIGADEPLASNVDRLQRLASMLVRTYTNVLKQTVNDLKTDLRGVQKGVDNSITALKTDLTTFNDTTVINDAFIRDNFLEVDIFYGEMKYRTIVQTTGYDIVQFLSDFGGSFGLFLGGSILSIFEFLDLIFYNLLVKMSLRSKVGT